MGVKYFLSVGTLEPRKNLQRVITAYSGLPNEIRDEYQLWVVGGKGWRTQEINKTSGARLLDFVSHDDLPSLYQRAVLFVYPSLYEGFGLPILEAMAAGVPVITSNVSSLPEVAGKEALLVDPYSVEDIRAAIVYSLSRDLAKTSDISDAGVKRAREFTWKRTAEMTLRIYEEAAGVPN